MLIQKGGITRNIEDTLLHVYTAKGYTPVETETAKAKAKDPPKKKPVQQPAKE